MIDPIVRAHCLHMESFLQLSVAIVIEVLNVLQSCVAEI